MKKYIGIAILLVSIGVSSCSSSQSGMTTEDRKAEKAARKAIENARQEAVYETVRAALTDQEFVLEADRIYSRRGRTAYVSSNTNFVMVNNDRATVQIALNNTLRSGPNGIGGITVEGIMSDVKMKIGKKGNIDYSFNVLGVGISAQVNIVIPGGSDYATVTVNSNFSSNRFTMYGRVVPLQESSVYKARPL